ncbi:unnamed protein product [Diabrotica balteata]|uniref:Uncharacterized protein n=1 Tax=Diabrotica balteata TaxID=107213 RepID=A0A9N9TE68_DIABA|nr:unnamed protein product [Diabrotica balteata]
MPQTRLCDQLSWRHGNRNQSGDAKPRLKKDVIPSQFSWTEMKRESAKQRNERMIKRALRNESSHLSSISSTNPIPTEPCNEVEIESTPIEIDDHEDQLRDKCGASNMTTIPLNSFFIKNLQ